MSVMMRKKIAQIRHNILPMAVKLLAPILLILFFILIRNERGSLPPLLISSSMYVGNTHTIVFQTANVSKWFRAHDSFTSFIESFESGSLAKDQFYRKEFFVARTSDFDFWSRQVELFPNWERELLGGFVFDMVINNSKSSTKMHRRIISLIPPELHMWICRILRLWCPSIRSATIPWPSCTKWPIRP